MLALIGETRWSRQKQILYPMTFHSLSTTDVCRTLSRVNARKGAGPDGVPGQVLRACAKQLCGVYTHIFNLSLAQVAVPTIFKTATIVPVRKHSTASDLKDFRPIAITPIIPKCFERLMLFHLKSCLPATLDPHQFTHQKKINWGCHFHNAPHRTDPNGLSQLLC